MRKSADRLFIAGALAALGVALLTLSSLLVTVLFDGLSRIDMQFLTSFPSRKPEEAGILSSLVGSIYLTGLTALIAVPLGIGSAVYLEQYAKKNWFNLLMEINIGTLAGVPSIIYGLLGLGLFVRILHFDRSLLAGSCTLALLILPIVILASREAIRTVSHDLQHGAFALGATESQVIRRVVFPLALPGILTGVILALSRAIGETAPLIAIGALTYIAFLPDSLFAPFTALPIQIFNWVSRPQPAFHENAAAGIIILLVTTLLFNAAAILIRNSLYSRSARPS
ncbi:phosphate ABC transporter, permease protein PstA [Candidatus Peregrinibacteria bacterium CG10_big_fil_rev_8_21_14_0_10_49_16]|nr:MAG: phosphate ABC transporter, permease protein PstA [Candidatus Peregrinibacteria bacterium CG10_big_fil_rev_8_21_14_0_10_49_16]